MWCHVPGTDSPSAQAAEALIWASCLPNPAFTPDASSSGKNIPAASSSPPNGPDTSPPRPSGTTSPHSAGDPSGAQSTPSSPDTPASHSHRPDSEREPTTSGTCGPMSPASSARSSRNGCSSKTSPGTSPSALKPCCESYGTWAGRLRLAYSRRLKLARRMNGSAGSAWPTATPMQTRDGWTADELDARRAEVKATANNGNGFGLSLGAAATSWPTPMAGTPAQNGNSAAGSSDFSRRAEELARGLWQTPRVTSGEYTRDRGQKGAERLTLEGQGAMWGTPRASDATKGGPNMAFGAGGTPLPAQAAQWPTPAAQNVKGSSPDSVTRADGKSRMDILHYRAEQGFSRPDQETPRHGLPSSDPRQTWRQLRRLVISTHGRATWKRMAASGGKRRLNPNFVAWLMGWPIGHPSCACSATEWSRFQRHMRGVLSRLPTASGAWIWKPPNAAQKPVQIEMFGG